MRNHYCGKLWFWTVCLLEFESRVLCWLMTPGLNMDIWYHVWSYSFLCFQIIQIRHQVSSEIHPRLKNNCIGGGGGGGGGSTLCWAIQYGCGRLLVSENILYPPPQKKKKKKKKMVTFSHKKNKKICEYLFSRRWFFCVCHKNGCYLPIFCTFRRDRMLFIVKFNEEGAFSGKNFYTSWKITKIFPSWACWQIITLLSLFGVNATWIKSVLRNFYPPHGTWTLDRWH